MDFKKSAYSFENSYDSNFTLHLTLSKVVRSSNSTIVSIDEYEIIFVVSTPKWLTSFSGASVSVDGIKFLLSLYNRLLQHDLMKSLSNYHDY